MVDNSVNLSELNIGDDVVVIYSLKIDIAGERINKGKIKGEVISVDKRTCLIENEDVKVEVDKSKMKVEIKNKSDRENIIVPDEMESKLIHMFKV